MFFQPGFPGLQKQTKLMRKEMRGPADPEPNELPEQLHLLTLMVDYDQEAQNVLIMRIEHIFERADDPTEVSIDLGNFLNSYGFNVISMVGDFWYNFSPMQIRTFRIWSRPIRIKQNI